MLFGAVPEWLGWYSVAWYVVLWVLFGLTQACGWPMEVAIMSRWFGKGNRGLVLGLWAACQSVGNIVGAIIVSHVLFWGYQVCLSHPGTLLHRFGSGLLPPRNLRSGFAHKGGPL